MSSTEIQRQEITALLEVIAEQTESIFLLNDGEIPQIEIDLVCDNIRKLYANFVVINKMNSKLMDRLTDAVAATVIKTPTVTPHTQLTKGVVEEANPTQASSPQSMPQREPYETPMISPADTVATNQPLSSTELGITSPKPLVNDLKPEQAQKSEPSATPKSMSESKAKPVSAPKNTGVKEKKSMGSLFPEIQPSIADQFKSEKQSLYEKIVPETEEKSLVEKLQQKPITDLSKSIGINDRFLFVKELFLNNVEEYNDTIQLLNNFSSLTQAFDYLDVLKQKFGWIEDSGACLKFYDLVRRKQY